jgi:hypothetical protein
LYLRMFNVWGLIPPTLDNDDRAIVESTYIVLLLFLGACCWRAMHNLLAF